MKSGKNFDCVEMKRLVQERIMEERARMSPEAYQRLTDERLLSDPVLARFWERSKIATSKGRPAGADETGIV